jgi:hypothetical protein
MRGRGWTAGRDSVSPGYLVNHPYPGPGKDCAGVPVPPGYIFNYSSKGLPGLSGGRRRRNRKIGGVSYDPAALPLQDMRVIAGSLTDKPGYLPNPSGSGGSVSNPNPDGKSVIAVPPGGVVPPGATTPKQSGGRYGFFPAEGPLNASRGIGTSPAPFHSIPCERGTTNPLNLNPGNVQSLTTLPSRYMNGGASVPANSGLSASAATFPVVHVGAADSMRYYAPNAGYSNTPVTFPGGSATPGYLTQPPYAAGSFNRACLTTGGGKRKNKRNGGGPLGDNAAPFTDLKMDEITTRSEFDGTRGLLPMKFGGSRRHHKKHHKRTKRHHRKH